MSPSLLRLPLVSTFTLAALLGGLLAAQAANTEKDVLTSASALDSTASYQDGTLPGKTSNLTFTGSTYTNTTFSLNGSALSIGALYNYDTSQALTISASQSLTLNGNNIGSDPLGNPMVILLSQTSGANLTYGGTGGLVLAADGLFSLAGSTTVNTPISGPYGLKLSGSGTLTLTGNNTYAGNTLVTGGTLAVTGGSVGTAGGTGTFTVGSKGYSGAGSLSGTATINAAAATIGGSGVSYFTQSGGTFSTNGGQLNVGVDSAGSYNLSGGTLSTGTAYIAGSTTTSYSNANGTLNQTGGTFTTNGNPFHLGFAVAGYGGAVQVTWMMNGGTLSTGAATIGENVAVNFIQNGGTFTTNGAPLVIDSGTGGLTMYQLGTGANVAALSTGPMTVGKTGMAMFGQGTGSVTTNGNPLTLAANTGSQGSYRLRTGGTLTVSGVVGGSGQSEFDFGGGTLQASTNNANFLSGLTTIGFDGGSSVAAMIDTQNYLVTIAQNLPTGSTYGNSLTKLGLGTLTLTGTNTYGGTTLVSAGTLAITAGSVGVSGSNSIFTVYGTAANNPVATLSGGSLNAQEVYIGGVSSGSAGAIADGTGTFTQTGGTLIAGITFSVGSSYGTGGGGRYNLQGGSLSAQGCHIGGGAVGTFTQTGGTFTNNAYGLSISNGAYDLNGGTCTVGSIYGSSGSGTTSTFNFNGGTLRAGASGAGFLQGSITANVRVGGAVIDTNGYSVTAAVALVHDTTSGAPSLDGGLTKNGAGALTLSAANTYTGPTQINAGTLALSNLGTLGNGTGIGVAAAGTLDVANLPGGYTLTTGHTLTNLGVVNGNLKIAANATYTGGGTVSGLLTVQSGGLVTISGGTLTVNGGVINSGTIRLRQGASLTVGGSSTFTNNSGATLDIITGRVSAPAGFTNNGMVIDSSVIKARSVARQGGVLTVVVDGYTGHAYQLQRSDSLVNATYTSVGNLQTGTTGQALIFADPSATGAQDFYRVQVDP